MNVLRAMFILAIVTVAVLASECVFIIATLNQDSNFQEAYESASVSIIDNFYKQVNNLLWNAKGLTTTIGVTYRTSTWPNVTISMFPSLCESTMTLSHASSVSFQPMVTDENRISWETYASFAFPLTTQKGGSNLTTDETIDFFDSGRSPSDGIYQFHNGTSHNAPLKSDEGMSFPIWQMHPPPSNLSNSDLLGIFFDEFSNPVRAQAIQSMLDRQGSTMSSFLFQDTNHSDVAYHHVPRSNLYYPILDNDNNTKTKGTVNVQIKWDAILQGAQLDHNETMLVVIDNSCGGTYTYQVQGDYASYYGPGSLQNKTVNGDKVSAPSSYDFFLSLFNDHGMIPMETNSSCSYKISVYASQEFKNVVSLSANALLPFQASVVASFLTSVGFNKVFHVKTKYLQSNCLRITNDVNGLIYHF